MTHNLVNDGPNIALFEPDIPQNTAAIIRTCACLGAKLEIIEPCGFLLSDKRFKRVVMDYMDENQIKFYESSNQFFEKKRNQRIILMTTKATVSYTKFKFNINDTIMFGRESAGVPNKVHKMIKDSNHLNRLVTLSPLTAMAEKFHLRNGAKLLQKNLWSQNFEYSFDNK